MPRFRIQSVRYGDREVSAANWLIALGVAMEQLCLSTRIERLACEVLRNGQILVQDARLGEGFVVQPMGQIEPELPNEETSEFLFEAPEDTTDSTTAAMDAIRAAVTPDEAALAALTFCDLLIPADGGAVLLVQPDGSMRFIAATGESGQALIGQILPPRAGFAGFCVEHSAALNIHEPYSDARFHRQIDERTGQRTRSLLCVPLRDGDRVLGCLEMVNAAGPHGFARGAMADAELISEALTVRLVELEDRTERKNRA